MCFMIINKFSNYSTEKHSSKSLQISISSIKMFINENLLHKIKFEYTNYK